MSTTPPTGSRLAHLAREFLITVALSFFFLLAIVQTIRYQVLRALGAPDSACAACTPCTRVSLELAALTPLAILKITTACAVLVFLALEAAVCLGWRSVRPEDVEATGETSPDAKTEKKIWPPYGADHVGIA
ncbi:hypothetical protein B0H17DRAFT_677834 [Mycena rosella]|uniref:Uncharacterized protein n=1 Tax=Mycena rosella TaxID=1033263 RepID=A0AAD7BB71_MYCRO|nr:hypothetical protein B0H17DRAFT_677834 [Mycena rosella]